ncbi:MAG: hypothetical protein KatS3mg111_1238 [Pirellulaceae bacterium]|nr:MAG: hypothetical protein KatS3mg111_1238 [Pirellulaceae bacterium]
MAIQLDPSRWLVSFAGFVYDWIISRSWLRILAGCVPVAIAASSLVLVWWGATTSRSQLAARYMARVEEEFERWERGWAGAGASSSQRTLPDAGVAAAESVEKEASEKGAGAAADAAPRSDSANGSATDGSASTDAGAVAGKLSRFAEAMVRRVQLIAPSDCSHYLLGASMVQHGAVEQGLRLLEKVAPADRPGYKPAHAFAAIVYLAQIRQPPAAASAVEAFLHHVEHAETWAPSSVLWAASDIHWLRGMQAREQGRATAREEMEMAVKLLEQAVVTDRDALLELCKRALAIEDRLTYDQHLPLAEAHWRQRLDSNPRDADARARLAETLLLAQREEEAQQVLEQGLDLQDSPVLRRSLSELFRRRFHQSLRSATGIDLRLLEMALRHDPTNVRVYEEVAAMIRLGKTPPERLQQELEKILVSGQATASTHLLLAENLLLQEDYEGALPHLEQVVTRMPNAIGALNNYAWVMATVDPRRLDEAAEFARRAIRAAKHRPNPEYYDTLGMILVKQGNHTEAITAYETALELAPQRRDFHERLAELYAQVGNERLAHLHRAAASLPVADPSPTNPSPTKDTVETESDLPSADAVHRDDSSF